MFWSQEVRSQLIDERRRSMEAAAERSRLVAGPAKAQSPARRPVPAAVRGLLGRIRVSRKPGLGTSA